MTKKQTDQETAEAPAARPAARPVLPSGGGSYTVKGGKLDRREGTEAPPMRNSNKEG